jgi:predicted N-acetyltransferase YhbS
VDVTVRREEPADHRAVEELTRDAFWGLFEPRCAEHLLVHLLRQSRAFVPELACVAEVDGRLVGHVAYSRAWVTDPAAGARHGMLTFGPLSVDPRVQAHGVGAALVRHTVAAAARQGHRAIVLYGHPDYYPRFGFRPAATWGITAPGGATFDALMALPLAPGGIDPVSGEFHEDAVFDLDPARVAEFDRTFPPRPEARLHPLGMVADGLPAGAADALGALGVRHLEDLRRLSRAEVGALPGMDDDALDRLRARLAERGIRWGAHGTAGPVDAPAAVS